MLGFSNIFFVIYTQMMNNLKTYILTAMLLAISVAGQAQLYHATDTLDEDDYISRRDTIKMSRRNIALERNDRYYGTDYVIDDRYLVANEPFAKGLLGNTYISGGVGFDFLQPRSKGYDALQMTQFNIALGKHLSPVHSLRLAAGGAVSFLTERNFYFVRGTMKLDYLYDVSAHISGYKAARPVSVSMLAGIGANVMRKNEETWSMRLVPDLHAGLQFKIYTGPRCYLNIEPYASISTDQLDYKSEASWRKYDVSYGVNLNLQYYLDDQLSSQSRLRLLNARGDNSIMVDKQTVGTWRTPWFTEAASGVTFAHNDDLGLRLGNTTGIALGRWLSPVLGFRLAAVTTSAMSRYMPEGSSMSGYAEVYNSHYNSGRVDFLINPLGYMRNFSWDDQFGGYLVIGTELGTAKFHNAYAQRQKYYGQTVTAGLHLWTKLTDDLQLFVEPRYSHNTFSTKGEGKFTKNIPMVNIGLTMMIRSQKFHELDEFDQVQNFMHSYVRGFRVGATGGMTVLQPRDASYDVNNGWNLNWNGSAYLEYRFSHLHSVRGSLQYMNSKRNVPTSGNSALTLVKTNSAIASLDYEVSVTNLFSGILKNRWCELEAFVGPSAEYVFSTKGAENDDSQKKLMWGANAGLKLSKHIWNGISLVAIPTLYFIHGTTPKSMNTVTAWDNHYYQTFSIGVQYKIGSFHRNPAKVRAAKLRDDHNWTVRQQEKISRQQRKLDRKNARLQQKYEKTK